MDKITETGYEYDIIQLKLNNMNETELATEYAQKLMDRADQIREEWVTALDLSE